MTEHPQVLIAKKKGTGYRVDLVDGSWLNLTPKGRVTLSKASSRDVDMEYARALAQAVVMIMADEDLEELHPDHLRLVKMQQTYRRAHGELNGYEGSSMAYPKLVSIAPYWDSSIPGWDFGFEDGSKVSTGLQGEIGDWVLSQASQTYVKAVVKKAAQSMRRSLARSVTFDVGGITVEMADGKIVELSQKGEAFIPDEQESDEDLETAARKLIRDLHEAEKEARPRARNARLEDYEPEVERLHFSGSAKAKTLCASADPSFKWLRPDTCVVRARPGKPGSGLGGPQDVSRYMHRVFGPELAKGIEGFFVLVVDSKLVPLGLAHVATGTRNMTVVDPAEVIRPALLLQGAAGIFLCHNHPSENPEPSSDDKGLTQRLVQAAQLFTLKVFDHIILTRDEGTFYSFVDHGDLAVSGTRS